MKTSVYIAMSLDGFIARNDGDIAWLDELPETGEDHGYGRFIETVDYLVMGRHTFEKVLTFGDWPYTKPVVVLSSRPFDLPAGLAESVETMSASPAEVVRQLSERGAEHLYVDGGKTIQAFLKAGLVSRLIITKIPVLLGEGIPLFGPLKEDIWLRHVETSTFAGGLVQCEYEVA